MDLLSKIQSHQHGRNTVVSLRLSDQPEFAQHVDSESLLWMRPSKSIRSLFKAQMHLPGCLLCFFHRNFELLQPQSPLSSLKGGQKNVSKLYRLLRLRKDLSLVCIGVNSIYQASRLCTLCHSNVVGKVMISKVQTGLYFSISGYVEGGGKTEKEVICKDRLLRLLHTLSVPSGTHL